MAPLNFNLAAIESAITAALEEAGEVLKDAAVQRVPTDTGELAASAGLKVSGTEAVVYFTAEHAVFVHESVGDQHDDGQAKYLESATLAVQSEVAQILAQGIRRKLG